VYDGSIKMLASETGLSPKATERAIAELEKHGLVVQLKDRCFWLPEFLGLNSCNSDFTLSALRIIREKYPEIEERFRKINAGKIRKILEDTPPLTPSLTPTDTDTGTETETDTESDSVPETWAREGPRLKIETFDEIDASVGISKVPTPAFDPHQKEILDYMEMESEVKFDSKKKKESALRAYDAWRNDRSREELVSILSDGGFSEKYIEDILGGIIRTTYYMFNKYEEEKI
jgi:hypothetical protein